MRIEGNYILGTIKDVAEVLYNSHVKDFSERFRNCDFAIDLPIDTFNFNDEYLKDIYENSTGWYGIKKINPGFDSRHDDNVDLFADYYGGGCGTYRLIGDWDDDDEIIDTIIGMIIETTHHHEGSVSKNTIVICELK